MRGAGTVDIFCRDRRSPAAHRAHARHPRLAAARRAGRAVGLRDQAGRAAGDGLPARGRPCGAARPLGRGDHRGVPGAAAAGRRARRDTRDPRRRGAGPGRARPGRLPAPAEPDGAGPRARAGRPPGRSGAGAPGAVRRPLSGRTAAAAAVRAAPGPADGAGPRRAALVDAGRADRARRRGARGHPGARPGGPGVQAARFRVRTRGALPRLDQDPQHAGGGRDRGRLAARQGAAVRAAGRRAGGPAGHGGPAALRRRGGHRLERGGADGAGGAAAGRGERAVPVRTGAPRPPGPLGAAPPGGRGLLQHPYPLGDAAPAVLAAAAPRPHPRGVGRGPARGRRVRAMGLSCAHAGSRTDPNRLP
ncbi:hypothetical protein SGPA1_21241 [Streptomyces misionensis JCM 4497]